MNLTRFCSFCKTEHPLTKEWWYMQHGSLKVCKVYHKEVHRRWASKDVEAKKERQTRYNAIHKDSVDVSRKKYVQRNPEKIKESKRKWNEKNKDYYKLYRAKKRKESVEFRLAENLRTRICNALRRKSKNGSAVTDVGCTISDLKCHLESLFVDGMSWSNWGSGEGKWNVDHVRPLASFDLSDRQQFLLACHYTNLQPLWHSENLKKGSKLEWRSHDIDV